jgi:glycyl-tRNA synthetase
MSKRLQTLTSFLQQQGFVWGPAPEIYGGVAGFYTYGPNGASLKRKIENRIRGVFAQYGIMEVEVPTVLPAAVWEASGHLGNFTDPLIEDVDGHVWRADHLLEAHYQENNITTPVPVKEDEILAEIQKHQITSPNGTKLKDAVKAHNLMMRTTIGLDQEAYNRPETATATYLPFLRYKDYFRKKLPFGVFQIGKAYRNEISPRQHLVRMREFTQAEAQIFIDPAHKHDYEYYEEIKDEELPLLSWDAQEAGEKPKSLSVKSGVKSGLFGSEAYAFTVHLAYELFVSFGIPKERLRLRQHGPEEKAFYATDAWDVEINVPTFGWVEACGVHDRGDYDLSQHAKHSGQEQTVFVEEHKAHVTPHVLEIAFGVDRPVYALLDIFYDEKEADEGKTTLKLPYRLAPIDVAVLPLHKKLADKARAVHRQLQEAGFIAAYDESSSIGKRYLRQSTIGTPHCVTIDFDTLEGKEAPKNTVTVRDRDSEAQERVAISDLAEYLRKQ